MDLYILTATLVALLYGLQVVCDKIYMTENTEISNYTLVLITLVFSLLVAIGLVPIMDIQLWLSLQSYVVFLVIGGIYAFASFLWFFGLKQENASKVSQLAGLEAVVTALSGIIFFNESLEVTTLLGLFCVIVSIFILLFDRGVARAVVTAKLAVIPILFCVLLWAAQDSLTNYIATEYTFLTVFFWVRISSFLCCSPIIFAKTVRRDFKQLFITQTYSQYFHIFLLSKLATTLAIFLTVYSIASGPLSVVAPLLGAYPIFTLLFGIIATHLTSVTIEPYETKHLASRSLSTVLFFTGLLTLFQL